MIKTFCDRCSNEIPRAKMVPSSGERFDIEMDGRSYVLCKDCSAKLKAFMEKPGVWKW